MTPTNHLYQLIKALSPSERRYYKVFSSRHLKSEKNLYRKLFDALHLQEEFNEEEIKNQFKDEVFVSQLSRKKNYLYNSILDGLFLYHQNTKNGLNLGKKIQQSNLLFSKGLFEQSITLANKTLIEAEIIEDYTSIYETILLLKRCHSFNSFANINKSDFESLLKKETDILIKLQNNRELQNIESTLLITFYKCADYRSSDFKKEIENIMLSPLLKDESQAITTQAKRTYYNIYLFYNMIILNNLKEAYHYGHKYFQVVEEKYFKNTISVDLYVGAINNYLFVCLELGKTKEIKYLCSLMKEVLLKQKAIESKSVCGRLFSLYGYQQLNYFIYSALPFNEKNIKELEEEMKTYRKYIDAPRKISILYQLAYYYFIHGDHKNSMKWINAINQDHMNDDRKMIVNTTALLKLMNLFDLKLDQQLSIAVTVTEKFLQDRNTLQPFEKTVLAFFKEYLTLKSKTRVPTLCLAYMNEINNVKSTSKTEVLRMNTFNFSAWLQSVAENTPMIQVMQKNVNMKKEELSFVS